MGDFQGGALVAERGERFEENNVWHELHGARDEHWIEPWTGERLSVVLFDRGLGEALWAVEVDIYAFAPDSWDLYATAMKPVFSVRTLKDEDQAGGRPASPSRPRPQE